MRYCNIDAGRLINT